MHACYLEAMVNQIEALVELQAIALEPLEEVAGALGLRHARMCLFC